MKISAAGCHCTCCHFLLVVLQLLSLISRMDGLRLGFLGGGVMATSLVDGILKSNLVDAARIIVSDPWLPCREKIAAKGIQATPDNFEVIANSDVIIVCVKPDVVKPMLEEISAHFTDLSQKSFISIAAGVTLSTMEESVPTAKSVIRVMPNTPCCVGVSASGYAVGSKTTREDKNVCEAIFTAVGTCSEVQEKLMDAVTGLSGSGPAYVFMFIEALADGGVRMGLPRAVAMELAIQTVKGAATMCQETGLHPGVLKDQVCSPGGTTIAGVEALEEHGFRAAAMAAVVAAAKRGAELKNSK